LHGLGCSVADGDPLKVNKTREIPKSNR